MLTIVLAADAFDRRGNVLLGSVASALARANLNHPNKFQAERNAWAEINAGIAFKKLWPIDPDTNGSLGGDNYGCGGVCFDDLAAWGLERGYEFEKEFNLDGSTCGKVGAGAQIDSMTDKRRAAVGTMRGVKREILEHWDDIKSVYGPDADVTLGKH